jgi:Mn2+/Fe2+ NRAMP family transporter
VLPNINGGDPAQYFYIAASILGANISPYLLFFYSSGGQEKGWTKAMLRPNYLIAIVGMGFGAVCAVSIIVVCAVVLQPRGIQVHGLQTVALGLVEAFGIWGVYLFAATLFITCFAAATEVAIATAFMVTQVMGWKYGQGKKPADAPAFNLVFLVYVIGATLLIGLTGINPLGLIIVAVTLTALILPIIVVPFLAIMNDPMYLADQTNGPVGNAAVLLVVAIAFGLSATSIPLTLLGA